MAGREREQPFCPVEIGSYRIVRLLGRGATAMVYECRHRTLGNRFAIKVLHPHLANHAVVCARFLREGRALARIAHPNVVEIIDIGEHEGVPFLVMGLVDGEDLAEHIRREHPMPLPMVTERLLPVVAAVAAAHERGIVHRDLKPTNIRIARDHSGKPRPVVLDFGISKWTDPDADSPLTDTGGILGTAAYMAPEQLRSAKLADRSSDIYALGVILYECATRVRPFRAESTYDLMHAVLTAPVAPPSTLRSDLPPAFDAVVGRAMRRNPGERFASATELGQALAEFAPNRASWIELFGVGASGATGASGARIASMDPSEGSFTLASRSGASTRTPRRMPGWKAAASGFAFAAAITLIAGARTAHPVTAPTPVPVPTVSIVSAPPAEPSSDRALEAAGVVTGIAAAEDEPAPGSASMTITYRQPVRRELAGPSAAPPMTRAATIAPMPPTARMPGTAAAAPAAATEGAAATGVMGAAAGIAAAGATGPDRRALLLGTNDAPILE